MTDKFIVQDNQPEALSAAHGTPAEQSIAAGHPIVARSPEGMEEFTDLHPMMSQGSSVDSHGNAFYEREISKYAGSFSQTAVANVAGDKKMAAVGEQFKVKKLYSPTDPPFNIAFNFLAEKKLSDRSTKDREHLVATCYALPHFVPRYKGRMPGPGDAIEDSLLRDWSNKHNQLLDEIAKIAENGLWVGIKRDLEQLGIRRCDAQELVGKHDILGHISNTESFSEQNYANITRALFRMKYIVPGNLDSQWYVDAEQILLREFNIKWDYSNQKGGKRNCFKAAIKRQSRYVNKQIEKRELIGNRGRLVRKCFSSKTQGQQWAIIEQGFHRSSGLIIELLMGQTRDSIKDAVSNMQPSTECIDMLCERFGQKNGSTGLELESNQNKAEDVLDMARSYVEQAVAKHGKERVRDELSHIFNNGGKNDKGIRRKQEPTSLPNAKKSKTMNNEEEEKKEEEKNEVEEEEQSVEDESEESGTDEDDGHLTMSPSEVKKVCFIRNGRGVRFCKEETCKVGFHFDCYQKVYNRGQHLKTSFGEEEAKRFYDRMHPYKKSTCDKMKEFDMEDDRTYFKIGKEDLLKRRKCPRHCTFCGRNFVGNNYEVLSKPIPLKHENDYLTRSGALACIESIQAQYENGDMDGY